MRIGEERIGSEIRGYVQASIRGRILSRFEHGSGPHLSYDPIERTPRIRSENLMDGDNLTGTFSHMVAGAIGRYEDNHGVRKPPSILIHRSRMGHGTKTPRKEQKRGKKGFMRLRQASIRSG